MGGSASFFHMSGLLSVLLWPLLVTAGLWGMLMTCGPWTLPCSKNSIDQDFQQCGRRRRVPSPEQGTSQITLSYLWPNIPRSGQYIQFCYLWRILESPLAPDISMQVSTMTINRCIQTRTVLWNLTETLPSPMIVIEGTWKSWTHHPSHSNCSSWLRNCAGYLAPFPSTTAQPGCRACAKRFRSREQAMRDGQE